MQVIEQSDAEARAPVEAIEVPQSIESSVNQKAVGHGNSSYSILANILPQHSMLPDHHSN